jgi:DNA-binding transcriptional ArsR family regulator
MADETPFHELSDPRAMRALAHPVRLALLEALAQEGPLTATQASELVGESPSSCSWHLRTLARYGFVEEAGGGQGRNRPWRIVARGYRLADLSGEPEVSTAAEELTRMWVDRLLAQLRRWLDERHTFPREWQEAGAIGSNLLYLTPDELVDLHRRFHAAAEPYLDRTFDPPQRPEGSLPVNVLFFGFPRRSPPSGG